MRKKNAVCLRRFKRIQKHRGNAYQGELISKSHFQKLDYKVQGNENMKITTYRKLHSCENIARTL